MSLVKWFLLIFLHVSAGNQLDVTFKNVTFHGYEMFTPRFKPTILYGNTLKNFIPNSNFDNIEFMDQKIPILYKDAIADINELNELIIELCEIEEIRPGAFRNLSHLNRLSLKSNKIEKIENNVFNHLLVATLDLSFNQISHIYTKAFDNMPELFQINLAHNLLSTWNPRWFRNTPLLSVLYFRNNFIEQLPANSFMNLKNDRFLSLVINFEHNRISSISRNAFSDLNRINSLSLSDNLLENFDKEILKNIEVDDLRLNNNSIKCLDDLDEILKGPNNYIEYNPFDCDCLERIQKWCERKNKNVGIADSKCDEDDENNMETGNSKNVDNVINIEGVREVYKDVYAIDKITLILPRSHKLRHSLGAGN